MSPHLQRRFDGPKCDVNAIACISSMPDVARLTTFPHDELASDTSAFTCKRVEIAG